MVCDARFFLKFSPTLSVNYSNYSSAGLSWTLFLAPSPVFLAPATERTQPRGETRVRGEAPSPCGAFPSGSRCFECRTTCRPFSALLGPCGGRRGESWGLPREGPGRRLHCGARVEDVGRSCLRRWGTPGNPCGPREVAPRTKAAGTPVRPVAPVAWPPAGVHTSAQGARERPGRVETSANGFLLRAQRGSPGEVFSRQRWKRGLFTVNFAPPRPAPSPKV